MGKNVQPGLCCGRKWDSTPTRGPGWRGSSHSSTPARSLFSPPAQPSSHHGLPRHLRPHARREEPAHGSVEVPGARSPTAWSSRRGSRGAPDLDCPTPTRHTSRRRSRASTRSTEQARKLERFFGAASFETELDAAGRIMIPAKIYGAREAPQGRRRHRLAPVPRALGPRDLERDRTTSCPSRSLASPKPSGSRDAADGDRARPRPRRRAARPPRPAPGDVAVDCTFGAGGHAALVAERLGPDGLLIAIDRDPDAARALRGVRVRGAVPHPLHRRVVRRGARDAARRGAAGGRRVPRLRDLLDADRRGRARLLLRRRGAAGHAHGPAAGARRAADDHRRRGTSGAWRATLREYGEERYAGPIARAIVRERGRRPIETTTELVDVVTGAIPAPRALRRRAPGQADLPGDPDRRQRRAAGDRRRAAAGVGHSPRRTAGLQGFPSSPWKTGA